jgi:hypothetical protein
MENLFIGSFNIKNNSTNRNNYIVQAIKIATLIQKYEFDFWGTQE